MDAGHGPEHVPRRCRHAGQRYRPRSRRCTTRERAGPARAARRAVDDRDDCRERHVHRAHTFDATDPITVDRHAARASGLARLPRPPTFDLTKSVQVSYAASPRLATCRARRSRARRTAGERERHRRRCARRHRRHGHDRHDQRERYRHGPRRGDRERQRRVAEHARPRAAALRGRSRSPPAISRSPRSTPRPARRSARRAAAMIVATGTLRRRARPRSPARARRPTPIGALALANAHPRRSDLGCCRPLLALARGRRSLRAPLLRSGRPRRTARLSRRDRGGVPVDADARRGDRDQRAGHRDRLPQPGRERIGADLVRRCTGVAASQPIAETATDTTGAYRIAVPDPM